MCWVSGLIFCKRRELIEVTAFSESLSQTVTGWTMLETSLGAIARLRDFERDTKVEAEGGEDFDPPEKWPSSGLVEIENVTASYKFVFPNCSKSWQVHHG